MLLQENSVVPVLYASQWFLTAFSCPFPSAFACRIIDVMMAEGNTEILLQVCSSSCALVPVQCCHSIDQYTLQHST